MSNEWEDETEDYGGDSSGGSSPGSQAKDLAKQQVKNKAKQFAKKKAAAAGKAATKLLINAGIAILQAIIASLPYILVPLGIIACFSFLIGHLYQYDVEERPLYQNYQTESGDYDNNYTENGVESISMENLVESAFYMSNAQQSYFKAVDGYVERAQVLEDFNESARLTQVRDKYNRESTFYLSDTFLWALDKYLHGRDYRYPEAFLRPLYMDLEDGKFELKDLVDENGNILVTSKGYDENGNRTDEDVPGVWDYGLAPVLNYKEFEEKARIVYNPRKKQVVVDTDGDGYADEVKWVDIIDDNDEVKMYEVDQVAGFPRTVYMIDKVATFLGVMENQITQDWVSAGQVADLTKQYKNDIIYEWETYYEEEPVYKNGKEVITISGKVNGKQKKIKTVKGCYKKKGTTFTFLCGEVSSNKGVVEFDKKPSEVVVTHTVEKQRLIEIPVSLHATYAGEQYEYIPSYVGDADFSGYVGDKYLRDYIDIYEAYIPAEVIGDFDLSERVSANQEELLAMVEQYKINFQASQSGTGGFEASQVGEMSGTALQNAYSPVYEPYFTKYAQMYGVDDRLLKAMAAQESGGNHDKYLSYERCSKAGCGLMQIEKPGNVIKTLTAYNFETGQEETITVCYPGQPNKPSYGCIDVTNIDNNIRAGAMQLAARMKAWDYNILMALQSYNFGVGGMNAVLRIYEQQEGVSKATAIANPNNLGWMKYRANVHQNPSILGSAYASWKSYGDDVYVEHVLRYFPSGQQIVVKKPSGEAVQVLAELPGLTGADMSAVNGKSRGLISGITNVVTGAVNAVKNTVNTFGNFMKSNFDKIMQSKDKWFEGLTENENGFNDLEQFNPPETNARHYKQHLLEEEKEILLSTIVAMEEGIAVSEVGELDDSFWRAKAENFFMNPYSNQIGLNETEEKSSDPYFNGEAISPLKTGATQTVVKYTTKNPEIALAAPVGAKVVAIYDGKVKEISNLGKKYGYTVVMQHENGILSYYHNLDKDTVKLIKNQLLKKGDEIGVVAESTESGTQAMYFRLQKKGTFLDASLILNPTTVGGATSLFPTVSSGNFAYPMTQGYVSCEWDCYAGHKGVDLGNNGNQNTPIIASAAGVVIRSGWSSAGFGFNVIIKHNIEGREYHTLYAHMRQQPMVNVGDQVQQGQQLGFMGNTGNSFGAHLHFQVHEGEYATSTRVNPRKYINFPPERKPFQI